VQNRDWKIRIGELGRHSKVTEEEMALDNIRVLTKHENLEVYFNTVTYLAVPNVLILSEDPNIVKGLHFSIS
jgi:hypothetical protein